MADTTRAVVRYVESSRREGRTSGRCQPERPRGDLAPRDHAHTRRADAVAGRARVDVDAALHLRPCRSRTERHADGLDWGHWRDPARRGVLTGVVLRVFSSGEIQLRSTDPLD